MTFTNGRMDSWYGTGTDKNSNGAAAVLFEGEKERRGRGNGWTRAARPHQPSLSLSSASASNVADRIPLMLLPPLTPPAPTNSSTSFRLFFFSRAGLWLEPNATPRCTLCHYPRPPARRGRPICCPLCFIYPAIFLSASHSTLNQIITSHN